MDDGVCIDTRLALAMAKRDIDAIEIEGAASERVDTKKYPNRRFAWCMQAEFWEKYCELDGGNAASLRMPDPNPL